MAKRPNLLFIFTDEQRYDTMACYGNQMIETPHLNALAERSFVFENAYVTQPVCTPSRSSIMTGLYPHTCGCTANNIPLRPETPTIAEMVSHDYSSAYFGKWHLGDEIIAQHGFKKWVSIEDMYRRFYSREEYLSRFSDYHHFLVEKGLTPDRESHGGKVFSRTTAARLPEELTKASFLGERAAEFIRENRNRPFVLYVNFLEPHMPFTGPFDEMYAPEKLPVGPHFFRKPAPDASLLHRVRAEQYARRPYGDLDLGTEAGWRKLRARYWGLVTLVDRAVGVMLGALDECGLSDNTIVVFTSDHGDMMGDHAILAKCVMYEEALKVPLLVRVPWLAQEGRGVKGRINQIDLVPTLLELLNEPIPEHLEGESRAKVLAGQADLSENDVFVEWNSRNGWPKETPSGFTPDQFQRVAGEPWRTVVTADGWKLNLSPVDRCELYDLSGDPYEMKNLIDDSTQRERIRDLTSRIRQWQKRSEDQAPLPDL